MPGSIRISYTDRMKDDSQANNSIWMATADTPSQPRLKENIRTDVCIIGAGIAGLTTAYLLAREDDPLSYSTTVRSAAA